MPCSAERFLPKLPGGLILLVLGIAISAALDLSSHGVATVGDIPTGLPSPASRTRRVGDLWVLIAARRG